MTLYGLSRQIYKLAQLQSAAKNPGRYVKNRAKSHLLREAGFWRLWRKWWRA